MARKRERRVPANRQQQPGTTPSTDAGAGSHPQVTAGFTPWEPRWQAFLASHPIWHDTVSQGDPVYWLPEEVVKALSRSVVSAGRRTQTRRPVITQEEAAAEKAFRECCQGFSHSAVGVWQGQPVRYGLLGD